MERLSLILTVTLVLIGVSESYKIGLGRADVTGPSVEIAFVSFFGWWTELHRLLIVSLIRWATRKSINVVTAFTRVSMRAASSSRIRRAIESLSCRWTRGWFLTLSSAMLSANCRRSTEAFTSWTTSWSPGLVSNFKWWKVSKITISDIAQTPTAAPPASTCSCSTTWRHSASATKHSSLSSAGSRSPSSMRTTACSKDEFSFRKLKFPTQTSTARHPPTQTTPKKSERNIEATPIKLWCNCGSWTGTTSRSWEPSTGLLVRVCSSSWDKINLNLHSSRDVDEQHE